MELKIILLIFIICNYQYNCYMNNHYIRKYNTIHNNNGKPPNDPIIMHNSINDDNNNNENNNNDNDNNRISDTNNAVLNKWNSLSEDSREDIKSTILSFAIAFIVRVFLIEPRYIPSLSMFPTFDIGDQLLVDKISHIQRGGYLRKDVVVFNPTETYKDLTGSTEALIKRVVAIAGDKVEVKNHRLYINNVIQDENYVNEFPDYDFGPVVVPAGMLLVLGDNRNHSFDSHIWGYLPTNNVIGRAVLKYWPPNRVGFVEGSV